MDRLRDKGYGILLIYDNANNAREFEKYAPRGSAARLIVTSNAPDWRGVAAPVEIEVWPPEIGATFLIERTGQSDHVAAITLSEALGGLPLAHEQAAAYCERLGLSLAGYLALFKAGSTELLDADRDVPYDYGKTVAKTFSFAIDQAAKLHPAAESLIIYAALLAPEPIPLYLFSEGRENLFGPLASSIEGNGLNEAVAALRAFALISREVIHDERDASVTTDCVRLHRLVREVAAGRGREKINDAKRALIDVLGAAYPRNFYREPATWPRIRRLDAHGTELVVEFTLAPNDTQVQLADILTSLGAFRHHVLGAYSEARPLFERALAILERVLGREHRSTCVCVSFLALLLKDQGHPDAARPLFERVLKITETTKGTEHLDTASALNNLGTLLHSKGDFAGARPLFERALTIRENALGLSNPATALVMSNLGNALYGYGDLEGAESLLERALAIREETLGRSHPEVAASLRSLGQLLFAKRQPQKAWQFMQQALAMEEQLFGLKHPRTQNTAKIAVAQLGALGWNREAALLRERFAVPTN
jgi:tetratricopeptide (TPR) repeat protein